MFSCPHCQRRLIRNRTELGFQFDCPDCHGRAMAVAVIRRVAPEAHVKRIWKMALQNPGLGAACPSCANRMAEISLPLADSPSLVLDVCTKCQFLWFDQFEFDDLPKQAPAPPPKVLPEKAREALATAELRRDELREKSVAMGGSDGPDETWKWIPGVLGLPIETNASEVSTLPWVTWGTTLVLVITFLLTLASPETALGFALVPNAPFRLAGATLLTAFFLHAGLFHLIGNAYFLLVFGDNVEDYLGRARFIGLLIGATLFGALLHILADPRSNVPCVGASGGISGVIVYYALQFPYARLGILLRAFFLFRWLEFPAAFGLVMWLGYQFLLVWMQLSGMTNVSALAHLGGAAVGFAAWILWNDRSQVSYDSTVPLE